MTGLFVFALTLLAAVLVSDLADRSVLSTAVLFLLAGVAAGVHRRALVDRRPRGPLARSRTGLILGLLGLEVSTELFPRIDSGEFVLRFRPPPGSSYELTREMGLKCLQEIEHEAGAEKHRDHDGLRRSGRPEFRHR